jgi:hypothetical protein
VSTSITPEILQSDNGSEFVGDCIKVLKQFYSYSCHKGTYLSQGKIKHGHSAFKEVLQKWMN